MAYDIGSSIRGCRRKACNLGIDHISLRVYTPEYNVGMSISQSVTRSKLDEVAVGFGASRGGE
jgi:hypothetical protein